MFGAFLLDRSARQCMLDLVRFLLVFAVACSTSAAEVAPVPEVTIEVVPSADKPTKSAGKLVAHWTNVKTVEGCFYFSGPSGRDDRLVGEVVIERDDGKLRIRIANALFEGTYTRDEFVVARTSRHEFSGPWHVTETIRGKFAEGFTGKYHYDECELGGTCPGRCTIDADLVFRP